MAKQAQKNPHDVAQTWQKNLSGSTTKITNGVNAVTTSPMALAAKRSDAYVAGIQRAVADGRWQKGLLRTSLPDWQNAMVQKGIPRIASGATAAVPKMESFMQQFLPYVYQGQAALSSTPRGDLEQNIQRMVQMVRHNANFKRSQ